MKKVFVLRTEALLASKDPTLRFGDDNTIVVPMGAFNFNCVKSYFYN